MRTLILAAAPLLALAVAAPAFSQGATQSPPAPNASNNVPQSPNSVPPGARTMAPNTTGTGRIGSITTTRYGGSRAAARHRRAAARPRVNPDMPEGQTVPVPQTR